MRNIMFFLHYVAIFSIGKKIYLLPYDSFFDINCFHICSLK